MEKYKNRIVKLFNNDQDSSKKLICYFPVGDPTTDSVKMADSYLESGVDVLEIGLAVKNPYLDGQTVSDSMKRVRETYTLSQCLDMVKEIRANHNDAVLEIMCYKQIFDEISFEDFNAFLKDADIDALLVADSTLDDYAKWEEIINPNVSILKFLNYNCTEEEMDFLSKHGDGFVFLQAVNGGTGARKDLDPELKNKIDNAMSRIKTAAICPGFGISTPDHCKTIKEFGADGLIIGSEVIKKMLVGDDELRAYLRSCKDSLI